MLVDQQDSVSFGNDLIYYLADSYYKQDKLEKAIIWFDELLQSQDHPYVVRGFQKRGDAHLRLGNSISALENYHTMLAFDQNTRTDYLALYGMMMAHKQLGNNDTLITLSEQILTNPWKPINTQLDLAYERGLAFFNLEKYDEAQTEFTTVLSLSNSVKGAEALYYLAFIDYDRTHHEGSLSKCFDLISNFASFNIWVDKAYLLIADNYLATEDYFQAKATLNSIIENATENDLKAEAAKRLVVVNRRESEIIQTKKDTVE
jgi:tetratricopeptide (TPR) repeat protein